MRCYNAVDVIINIIDIVPVLPWDKTKTVIITDIF